MTQSYPKYESILSILDQQKALPTDSVDQLEQKHIGM